MLTIVETDGIYANWSVISPFGKWMGSSLYFEDAVKYIIWLYDNDYVPRAGPKRKRKVK